MEKNSKNEERKWNWKHIGVMLLIIIALLLIPPSTVNLFTKNNLKATEQPVAPPWIGFWGSYLGGMLGSIAALLALFETRHQSRLQQFENNENRRLSVMPAIDMSCRLKKNNETVSSFFILERNGSGSVFCEQTKEEYYKYKPDKELILCFTNIGLGPAFEVQISYDKNPSTAPIKVDSIKAGNTDIYGFNFSLSVNKDESFPFSVLFTDILGNTYKQSHVMKMSSGELFFSAASTPDITDKKLMN